MSKAKMSNEEEKRERNWLVIIPIIAAIIGGIIGGLFLLIGPPQSPTSPIFKEIGGDTDDDGNYKISWESSKGASSYILEEDTNPSFTSPETVYSGPETIVNIYGKSNGDYYYRIRARNKIGDSGWSSSRKITVISPPSTPTPMPTSTPTPTPTSTPTPTPTSTPTPTPTSTPTPTPTPGLTPTPSPSPAPTPSPSPAPTPSPSPTPTPSPTLTPPPFTPVYVHGAYYASGWMGDWGDITFDDACTDNPHSDPICIKIAYSAAKSQGEGWAGIYWQHPDSNWGDKIGGYDLTGATKLTFWAKGEKGGEKAEFKVGGITGDYPDSLQPAATTRVVSLSDNWQKFTINLAGKDLSHIIGGFCWVTNKNQNPYGCTIYLDDIRFE